MRVCTQYSTCSFCLLVLNIFLSFFYFNQQGLQRRATPHPSELKVMKNVIEARRNEAYTAKPDDLESPDSEVGICL